MPGREECMASMRTPGGMENDALANRAANVTLEKMAKKALNYNSIKNGCSVPLQDILNIIPAGLHITLMVVLASIKMLETWCDVIDCNVTEDELAAVAEGILDGEESRSQEEDELEEGVEGQEGTGAEPEEEVLVGKAQAEQELLQAEVTVGERQQEVVELASRLAKRKTVLQRVALNKAKDWVGVENLAKEESKNTTVLKSFKEFCSPLCLLTCFDTPIKWKLCSQCSYTCHEVCQLWQPDAVLEQGQLCRVCRDTFSTYEEMEEIVTRQVEELRDQLALAQVEVSKAKAVASEKRNSLKHWVGPSRRRLLELLEDTLHVSKTAYMGGTYVGNHCQKILNEHEVLAEVLNPRPEIKELFLDFCSNYHAVHKLMKASRWLTDAEVEYTVTPSSEDVALLLYCSCI